MAAVGAVGAAVGIFGKLSMGPPISDAQAVVDAVTRDPSTLATYQADYDRAKSNFESQQSKAVLGGAVFAAAWLYGILDASFNGASGPEVSVKVVPDHNGGGSRTNVGFSFAVGRARP